MTDRKDSMNKLYKDFFYGIIIYSILCIVFSSSLSFWFNANIAEATGVFISMILSFTVYNARISFPKVHFSNMVKYIALHTPDLIFQVLMVFLLRHGFGCNKFIAYAVAAVLGMPVAYVMIKKQLRNDDMYYALDFHDDSQSFIEWINEHQVLTNVGIFVLLTAFFSISNWSILIGENLMKYDIWDAEYYLQVLMSDALAGHTIPMWNPLMQYGSPWYSYVGTPVWYPFTLILAYFGYTPVTIAISYVMHLVIGGFGAFLLISLDTRVDGGWTVFGLWTGITGGLLYGGCTRLFLSNAQHIMIIISAAWIPCVFYYMRRFIVYKQLYYGALAGLCAGLLFLGGYPEMFFNLFLFLFAYVTMLCYQKEKGIIISFGTAVFRFGMVCVFTVLSCAISLIPFLCNKNLLTRGNGVGVVPGNYPLYTLLSALFPKMTGVYPDLERSMVNYYMGILVILLIPMLIKNMNKNKKIYSVLAADAFMLCGGSAFFILSILYRFLPMYSAFRFSTTNRAFLSLFMILLIVPVLKDIQDHSVDIVLIRFTRLIF